MKISNSGKVPKEVRELSELAHAYQEEAEPKGLYPNGKDQELWQDGYWAAMNFAGEYLRQYINGLQNKKNRKGLLLDRNLGNNKKRRS